MDNNLKNIKNAQITQKDVIPNKKSVQINVGSNYKTNRVFLKKKLYIVFLIALILLINSFF